MDIYCGNNLYELGDRRIGTPYECLQRGIGRGLNSDISTFNPNYRPIIEDNVYCGTGEPPRGKVIGTPSECLRKGIGVGKSMQYRQQHQDVISDSQPTIPPVQRIPQPPNPIPQNNEGENQLFKIKILRKWWPIIVALIMGLLMLLFKCDYLTIVLTMMGVLLFCWFIQYSVAK